MAFPMLKDPVSEASHTVNNISPSNNHLLTGLTERAKHAKVKILIKRALNTANLLSLKNGTLMSKQQKNKQTYVSPLYSYY